MSLLRSVAAAFSFLTRLPIPGVAGERELGRSVVWFPLVGAAMGAVLVGAARAGARLGHLPPGLLAVALVALLAAMSGGLHLDGLADTFDALGGGRGDRARMLEIMRDSRIGAHGAAALFLVLIAKTFAIGDLLARGADWALFVTPVLARWAVVPLIVFFRYARPSGLGDPFRRHAGAAQVAAATALPLALAVWAGGGTFAAGGAALGVALALGAWLNRRLAGLTGDVYGAAIELAELAALVTASR